MRFRDSDEGMYSSKTGALQCFIHDLNQYQST